MKRSAGVTAVAVVAILEGLLGCLFGALMVLGLVMMRTLSSTPNVAEVEATATIFMAVESILFLGLGGWTIASGIGVLRLKNWARISVSILGGLLAAFSLFGVLGALMVAVMPFPAPPGREDFPGFMTAFAWIMATVCLLQMTVGIWWPVQLNRRAVKEQFLGGLGTSDEPGRPLSITIIAWLMLVGGILYLPSLLIADPRVPAIFFGFLIHGLPGKLIYVAYSAVGVALGVGMLRLKPWGLQYAIWFCYFGLANMVANVVKPGAMAEFEKWLVTSLPKDHPWAAGTPISFMWFGMTLGLVFMCLQLWFLTTRKARFLAAAERAADRPQTT